MVWDMVNDSMEKAKMKWLMGNAACLFLLFPLYFYFFPPVSEMERVAQFFFQKSHLRSYLPCFRR